LVQARTYFERALTFDAGKLDPLLGVGGVDYSVQVPTRRALQPRARRMAQNRRSDHPAAGC